VVAISASYLWRDKPYDLPVLSNEKLVGLVSIGNMVKAECRGRSLSVEPTTDHARDIGTLLLRDWRHQRQRLSAMVVHRSHFANRKDIRDSGYGEIRCYLDGPFTCSRSSEPSCDWRRLDPGAPDDDRGIDSLSTSIDPVCVDRLDGGVQADLEVQAFKGCLGIGDQLFVEADKEVRPSLQ
jgi:hypothetical protein